MVSATSQEVFISYSHDTTEHMERVRNLSDKLRTEGVDCDLDQYEETPAEGWPRWMHRKIREAKFVLIICTKAYFQRSDGKRDEQEKDAGKGLGVICEGGIIIDELYEQGQDNLKFIPVIFDYSDKAFIPAPLRPTTFYNMGKKAGYDDLYRRLTGQPKIKKPELGKINIPEGEKLEALPEKEIKSSPAMLLLSPIEVKLWDAAKWSATFFIWGQGIVPTLGIAYRNEKAGRKIFDGWRERFGDIDSENELRIAIIDGPINGEEDGYTVHISLDPMVFDKKMKEAGLVDGLNLTLMVSRINRMTPRNGLANLERFKAEFAKHKKYKLAPAVVSESGQECEPLMGLGILKSNIVFKHSSEIGEHDLDSVVLKTGSIDRQRHKWASAKSH